MKCILMLPLFGVLALSAQEYTRGIGIYPGAPAEYAGPALVDGGSAVRNLALRRPAYHSSSYDYNLTAQLVTDGIKDTKLPRWIAVATSDRGVIPIHERELLFDQNWVTSLDIKGRPAWIQLELAGGDAPAIDRVDVDGAIRARENDWQNWTTIVSGSADGKTWKELARLDGMARPSGEIAPSVPLPAGPRNRFLKIEFLTGRTVTWHLGEIKLSQAGQRVNIAGPHNFTSAWMPAAEGEQWVYVDLGKKSTFDRVVLAWIRRPAGGSVQVSDDATTWSTVRELDAAVDDLRLTPAVSGRYVRVLLNAAGPARPLLSEMEVWGSGGIVAEPKPASVATANGLSLTGGAWRVQRDSQVTADPRAISTPGFADRDWLIATVPGTVLTSYLNAGAIPDPNYGLNQFQISDSFFHANFWYRDEFVAPAAAPGRRVWLSFAGINWKADVYLNGQKLGRIEGGFLRARFDVTGKIRAGQRNAVAVRIEKNRTPGIMKEKTFDSPGINGGALGADNPTYHASIGWDWIPTIHGRDTGIWNEVTLSTSGGVTVENPYVATALEAGNTRADVKLEATLRNHDTKPVTGIVRGRFGDIAFERSVTLAGSAETKVTFDPGTVPQLRIANPRLWWPNGYGAQDRYPVELRFETAGQLSDSKQFEAGIRQFTFNHDDGALRMFINGRRFVPRGGNWGFGESMLRYRAREYDTAIGYHKDMNFTMIRNWVGQIGEDAFYDACDRHGIVVWQDFWLANPWDGPNPDDNRMFLANVRDTILRIRNHPSIGLYCGRNEGYPSLTIDDGIRAALAELHPGIDYIPSSADDVVSGHGPYQAMTPKYYFTQRATPKMHSELGMPSIMTMDSMLATMPEESLWPQGRMWGVHDFSLHGAQGGESFRGLIDKSYGGAKNAAEWIALAQFVNYEGYRAMFEAQSRYRMGLLIWMSHPAWPSLVWQTYDYYFDTAAAYFGSKKASEPLHIQWNPQTNNVEVVNYNAGAQPGLTARAAILNRDGSERWTKSAAVDSPEDSVQTPIAMEYPAGLSAVHFLKLTLLRGDKVVSENLYWRGVEEGNYQAIRELPRVKVTAGTHADRRGDRWVITTELNNTGAAPALMVRVKVVREQTRDRILPALYSDNYVALMPGERRTITTELLEADTRGERPAVVVEGFNVTAQ